MTPPTTSQRISIRDVAAEAGVSPATVSRVLNNEPSVGAHLIERVEEVVARLGYRPTGPARTLRRQVAPVFAAIVSDVENPFFTSLVRGFEDVAQASDHSVVLCNSDQDLAKERGYIDIVLDERMAGVVLAPASEQDTDVKLLEQAGIPVIAVDRRLRRQHVDTVLVDNQRGAALATGHLLEQGFRRIACITGPRRVTTAVERLAGYRSALQDAGIDFDPALVRHSDFKTPGGRDAMADLLATQDIDAVFVGNNLMGVGALDALARAGLEIPDEVAVVAFDDAPWAPLLRPPLTTVAQPAYELGATAGRLLLNRRTNPNGATRETILTPELRVRESSLRKQESAK